MYQTSTEWGFKDVEDIDFQRHWKRIHFRESSHICVWLTQISSSEIAVYGAGEQITPQMALLQEKEALLCLWKHPGWSQNKYAFRESQSLFNFAVSNYLHTEHTHCPPLQTKSRICELLLQMCQNRQADVGQMMPSSAYRHKASSIWADPGSGLHGFLPDLCCYFAERPQALSTIWCTPAQTHSLWGICMKRISSTHSINNVNTQQWIDLTQKITNVGLPLIRSRSSYFWDCCSFRSQFCVAPGRDFCFLLSELWVLSAYDHVEAEEGRI